MLRKAGDCIHRAAIALVPQTPGGERCLQIAFPCTNFEIYCVCLTRPQLSGRETGRCLGLSYTTVRNYLNRAERTGFSWPLPEELTDAALDKQL